MHTTAQTAGVLHLASGDQESYFNTGIDLKDLFNAGNSEEATVEFWVKSAHSNNEWTLTDLAPNGETFSLSMAINNNRGSYRTNIHRIAK